MALGKFKHSAHTLFVNGVYDDRGTLQHAVAWDQNTYTFYVLDNARGRCPTTFSSQTDTLDGLDIIGAYSLEEGVGQLRRLPARVQDAIIKSFPYAWSRFKTAVNDAEAYKRQSKDWERAYKEVLARGTPAAPEAKTSKASGTKAGRIVSKANPYAFLEEQLIRAHAPVPRGLADAANVFDEPLRWPDEER